MSLEQAVRRNTFMHLLLGHETDLCCTGVLARMDALGVRAELVNTPLAPPARLIWRLDETGLSSSYKLPSATDDEEIESVLVRDIGRVDSSGWDPADHAYVQAETYATLLAWLEGLPCPVINRRPAALWYRNTMPLLAWRPLLRQCGLQTPDTIVTNDPVEARNFGRQIASGGVVLTPLTGEAAYLIASEGDWRGVAAAQHLAPVCLTEPHGIARSACVVADEVIWSDPSTSDTTALDARLSQFAKVAGLPFIEVAVATVRGAPAIVAVNPSPRLENFDLPARNRILDALVAQLTRLEVRTLARVG